MTAVRVLQDGGWIIHSLQQDGVLAEPGRLASGVGATPLATLAPRESQAIRAKGLRTKAQKDQLEGANPGVPLGATNPLQLRRRAHLAPFAFMSLDSLVLQHLINRGFKAEADKLRKEMGLKDKASDATAASSSRPALESLLTSQAAPMYAQNYSELREWVSGSLDAFKPELQQVLFPVFAHCYLALVRSSQRGHASAFVEEFGADHALRHRDELNMLQQVSTKPQLQTHAFAKRMLSQRYEVGLSSYSRALLLRFVQQGRLMLLIEILNEHVTFSLSRLQPSSHPDGVVAAAAQAWLNLSEEEARRENASEQGWAALRMVHEKHKEHLKVLAPHLFEKPEGEEGAEADKEHGDKGGKKKRGRKRHAAVDKASELEASLLDAALPLPPLSDKVERDVVKDELRKQHLSDAGELPSALPPGCKRAVRRL